MSDKLRWTLGWALAVYAAFRCAILVSGMTHVDDTCSMVALIQWQEIGFKNLFKLFRSWTSAPGSYLLTFPLLGFVRSPDAILWVGRGVSLAAWALGLGLTWQLLRSLQRLFKDKWTNSLSIGLFFWALASWRGFVESGQANNYAWTLAISAIMVGYFLGRLNVAPLGNDLSRGLREGLLLGLCLAFSYQSIPFFVAIFGALFIMRLLGVERGAWKEDAAALASFGFCTGLVYFAHLRHLQVPAGHPAWAEGFPAPGAELGTVALSILWGAWGAIQNVLAVLPWGKWTAGLASVALFVGLLGLLPSPQKSAQARVKLGLLILGMTLALTWVAGAATQRFPLGPSRHTYILQLPTLLLLGLGFMQVPDAARRVFFGALALAWLIFLPELVARTRNHVDLARIEALLDEHPDAIVANPSLAFTQDHLLLWKSRPDLRPRLYAGEQAALIGGPRPPTQLYLVSHRGPLDQPALDKLAKAGYSLTTLEERPPEGSWELAGNLNGGNGFYLYLAQRPEKI